METPSSTRRIAKSQASAPSNKSKQEDSNSRSRTTALLDITNDSPIVGVATGGMAEKTPSSSMVKNRVRAKQTPGSGEALLRGQVKTLLQKVEEGAELVNKLSFGPRPPIREILGLPLSPALLLAPTPANTPQVLNLSDHKEDVLMGEMVPSATEESDQKVPSEVAEDLMQQESLDLNDCFINRALLFDSPGKSEMSDSSTISYQGSGNSFREKSSEDDNSSAWSLQVNTSIQEDDEEGIEDLEDEADEAYYEAEGDDEEAEDEEESIEECYDDLCDELMKKMTVHDGVKLPEFTGKHTRFIYNSDGDIEGEEEASPEKKKALSPGALLLKGLPAPEGKHLRFKEEEED